jgi:hypothetical protein
MMGPPDAAGVDGAIVVVVEGGAGVVVVVVEPPPPPVPPPPPPVPPPPPSTGGVVVVVVDPVVVLIGPRCFMTPENSRLPVSFANFMSNAVLSVFEFRPTRADVAEASMVTMDTSRLVAIPSVISLGSRCAVFAKMIFLREPVNM